MPDLIAQGTALEQTWRRSLPLDRSVALGRDVGAWSVPWDRMVSKTHAELRWCKGRLQVRQSPQARNPIFVHGKPVLNFAIRPGEHFVIGSTTFSLVEERVHVSLHLPHPISEQTFSTQHVKAMRFRDADQRIEMLARTWELISGAATDEEMLVRLATMLLNGISRSSAVALVSVEDGPNPAVDVLHWDRRTSDDRVFQPSAALILRAVQSGESVIHIWGTDDRYTESQTGADADWAYCVPVPGAACRGWGIYVSGNLDRRAGRDGQEPIVDLRDDLKFTEVIASTLGNIRQARQLERNQASLRQFLSPAVLEALADRDPEDVLMPQETEATVLFCDLRGFTRRAEQEAGDLLGLLHRVSDALGIMTRHILNERGVVGDFHGDSAMGFWGWPTKDEDSVFRACQAALAIRNEFCELARLEDHPLAGFRMGIGLACGPAVAGKIGTVDQVKVTVFGPVVNRASRLESLTKRLHAPILLDETTAAAARRVLSPAQARIRRIAVFRLYGLETPLEISELLPPESEYPDLPDEAIAVYEQGLQKLIDGDWQAALRYLHKVPAEDQVKDFLTVFIAQNERVPPADWDGAIRLKTK